MGRISGPAFGAQDVEAADALLEGFHQQRGDGLLVLGQDDGVPHLLPILRAYDFPIDRGSFPGLGMEVLGANRVHLHICALGVVERLVRVAP